MIDGRGGDLRVYSLIDRQALTRQHTFVDRALAFDDDAVHRYAHTRAQDEDIAAVHRFDRDFLFLAISFNDGGFRRKIHQRLQCVGGLAFAVRFQYLAQRDEHQYHGGGFKVQPMQQACLFFTLCYRHHEQLVDAPDKGCCRAEGYQRVHVRRAVDDAFEAADKKSFVDDHHRGAEDHLHQSDRDGVAVKERRQGKVPHHMPHRKVHQHEQQTQRDKETL